MQKLKMSLVSVPFSGHLKIIAKLAKALKAQNSLLELTLVVTGWDNIKINNEDAAELRQAGIKIIELSQGEIEGAQPMSFTFPRVAKLADQVIEACKGSDYIVYDFFSIEGYIAAKKLNIPAVCSVPAIMGPFDPACAMLKAGLQKNTKYIAALESKYDLEIAKNLEMVSDGFLLPSDYQNIQWSWPRFIKAKKYDEARLVKNYYFMRPTQASSKIKTTLVEKLQQLKNTKKIIYVSLGTVVTGNLWNNVPETREFVRNIFNNIQKKFGNSDKYEVVVATGRNIEDLFETIPQNFNIYESVPQQEILPLTDVFVTHGGGNSVNEAIDAEIPMVVIPFFGDQHLCADNVAQQGIGISFVADEADKELVVDTESCHLSRVSMADEDAISDAIKKILASNDYKDSIKKIKAEKLIELNTFLKLLTNDKILDWKEGDLLYGCNDDRKKLAVLTGRTDFYRLCDMHPFSNLFADQINHDSMPRIIDQYHDVLTNISVADAEMENSKFDSYQTTLKAYGDYIRPYLNKIDTLDGEANKEKRDEVIWEMCLAGLQFFIYNKQKTIHFIVGKYNDQINLATKRELEWMKSHWQDEVVRQHVKFYFIQNGQLIQTDPTHTDWFKQRPTASLDDAAPDKLDQHAWNITMQQIRAHKKHLFFNHFPERYSDELNVLKTSGVAVIDMTKTPDLAKRSLASGDVHIFTIQPNGNTMLAPKQVNGFSISHATVASSEPTLCAGEVRVRSICVKGKWLKVIDLSNESGHYQPNATGISLAVKAFEQLGYIVHRVNVVHTKVKESFHKVDDTLSEFNPISRTMSV